MSEATQETQAAATETSEQDAQTQTKPTETVEFWKQKAREQETRAKANATAAQRLEEIENANKTETQRAADALTAAEKRAQDAEGRALRLEVATEKGLTAAQAKRLVGSTREELEADADELLDTFKPATTDDATEQVATSLDLGTRGDTTTAKGDPTAAFAKFLQNM
jgi:hypothetical protein